MVTAEFLREVLLYDPVTGLFTWRVARGCTAGSIAGSIRPDGYRVIRLKRKLYFSHRLVWLYVTGEWPLVGIDHKNLRKGDDRWENLREADQSQNGANNPLMANNTSGFKGVSWHRQNSNWAARIVVRGVSHSLGSYDDILEAHAAYAAAAKRYFGEYARVA